MHGTLRTQETQITWPRRLQAKHCENSLFASGGSEGPRVGVGDSFRAKVALGRGEGLLEKMRVAQFGKRWEERYKSWPRIDAQSIY